MSPRANAPAAPPIPYEEATERVARRQALDDSVVATGGRTILMTHGARTPRVFVLLHGFTDSPTQFQVVGTRFFDAGDNVYIPRLPHHAERRAPIRALGRVRAGELASFGDSAINEARGLGDTVIVVGLSAGGDIGAEIAQSRADVLRAVLIAPAIAPGRLTEDGTGGLVELASRLPDITRTAPSDTTRPDFVQGLTTHGLAQVLRLGQRVRDEAERVPSGVRDIVFLLNENDHTVSEEASLGLAQSWFDRGARVQVYRFPKSLKLPHNVMELTERGGNVELVFPVLVALATAAPSPFAAELQSVPCGGFRCALNRALHRRPARKGPG